MYNNYYEPHLYFYSKKYKVVTSKLPRMELSYPNRYYSSTLSYTPPQLSKEEKEELIEIYRKMGLYPPHRNERETVSTSPLADIFANRQDWGATGIVINSSMD